MSKMYATSVLLKQLPRIVAQTIHVVICLNSNTVPSFQHLTTS